ncbi:MAG: hypothetical protein BYD32DRAFT_456548 [Podila humilis]|nr:MAG: hypothetical protein BYD32DRAFT_456548 [Podila humilis]
MSIITITNNPFAEDLADALKAYVDLLPEFNCNFVVVHNKIHYAKLHPKDDSQFAKPRFALEYYSKVLEGLHSHIAFLHTHVDYADCNHSNIIHRKRMANRHRAFRSIFRDRAYVPAQHAQIGHDSSAENDTEYKKFEIDMKVAKRPITQCMIRNTVREILKLAVDSAPAVVNTSVENKERFNALPIPKRRTNVAADRALWTMRSSQWILLKRLRPTTFFSEANMASHRISICLPAILTLLKTMPRISRTAPLVLVLERDSLCRPLQNTFTILVLGETQSDKSMLIESFKQYVNLGYVINTGKIGDGAFSHTTEVKIERLFTNLPKSFVSRVSDDSRKRVDYEAFIDEDPEDYEDEVNDRKTYQVGREQSDQTIIYFNLIDTPGLNETGYLENVFRRLRNISEINMVIVTVSNNPFTQDLKDALKKLL